MIDLIFSIDYEIYGNGTGSLRDLVYEPAEKLITIFRKWDAPFVAFVESSELEMIDAKGKDGAIVEVRHQIKYFREEGIELGLHLHPQWYGAIHEKGLWALDYGEYNLCEQPRARIIAIVDRAISYLKGIVEEAGYVPEVFRAGNWLFQPTRALADILYSRGIRIDSSVYKGGLQHKYGLDYRRALRNGYYWTFRDHVEVPDSDGMMLELPIYTRMVPAWKMLTSKRVSIQGKGSTKSKANIKDELFRISDLLRFKHPLKLDFCRMTIGELVRMTEFILRDDDKSPGVYKPVVAIGHTKDLVDLDTVDTYLDFIKNRGINISTFHEAYSRCLQGWKT